MKYIFVIIFMFLGYVLYAQKANSVKTYDTLYIYFNHGKGQEKFQEHIKSSDNKSNDAYYIYFNENKMNYILLGHLIVDNPEVRHAKKSFLRKNKNKIIKASKLREYDLKEALSIIGSKIVYIIDEEDFHNGDILLREVRTGSSLNDFEM
ncbi:MAG: hypothetical protein PSV16_02305 [Flavobacterium sp.]|nr:hypothetical protein [Flavobacterium sp.]